MNETDPTRLERASRNAGEYLDELGKTDLATLTREQWLELLTIVVCRYHD